MRNLFLIFILMIVVSLESAEIKTVTSIGFGENQEKAVDNALKEGLAKVVGMYMSSSTFVKNYQTINAEITSFSNGYIENYSVKSTAKKDGVVEVKVEMSVKTGILITKLKKLNIATIGVSVDANSVKKDLKMQNIVKVNQEKLAEEYYKQIVEPIKLNKAHFIKINKFEVFEITDIPRTHYGGDVEIKNLKTGEMDKFHHNIYLKDADKYDFMDEYYVIKVNYNFGITDEYYNNCISFMDAAFKKYDEKERLSDMRADVRGGDKIYVTKITSLMKTGIPDNAYKLSDRTIHRIRKYFKKNKKNYYYRLGYTFKAYDKSGFPNTEFNYVVSRGIGKVNNIMRFEAVKDPRNQIVQYSKFGKTLNDERFYFGQRNFLCNGVLYEDGKHNLGAGAFVGGDYEGNMYIFKEDYGISFNVYLVVPKTKISEIAEIKAELNIKWYK